MNIFTKKTIFSLFIVIISVLLIAIVRFDNEVKYQNMTNISDKLTLALHSQLEREKEDALRFALVLSQNSAIVDALSDDDEDRGYEVLSEIMNTLKKYTNTSIRSQIITTDFLIFARSWDNMYAGMPLEDSREDLEYFKSNKKPRVSIEVGRRLGIKATVPVYKGREILGYVEVLQFFDASTAFFRELGIDLYVLMDYDFYGVAVLMQSNPTVGEYIVANRAYNNIHLKTLERVDFKTLARERVLQREDKYLFFDPMFNADGKQLGAFVMVMPQTDIRNFGAKDEDISVFINFSRQSLYDIVKKEQMEDQLYKSAYDKALLYLKDTVADEDRELYLQEAHDILQSYSKDELIALILKHKNVRRIEGEIR
jgi:hypothetical protein